MGKIDKFVSKPFVQGIVNVSLEIGDITNRILTESCKQAVTYAERYGSLDVAFGAAILAGTDIFVRRVGRLSGEE